MKKILVLHGPNLNMTGIREPEVYGKETLEDINRYIKTKAEEQNVSVDIFQFNGEGEIITKLHEAHTMYSGVVLNAGAYTHYSYAIRDAIAAISPPVVEVHISDVSKREPFRQISVIREVCCAVFSGFGKDSYVLGIQELLKHIK